MNTKKTKREARYGKEIKSFLHNRLGMLGLFGVLSLFLVAIFAPMIAENVSGYGDYADKLLAPSVQHLMGTDDMALDIFAQVVWGTRSAILVGAIAVAVATVIGVPLGLTAGYYGGKVDSVIIGITDVFLTIPMLPLMIIMAAMMGKTSIKGVALIIGLFAWPSITRVVRSSTMKTIGMQYIEAAKCLGIPSHVVIFKHVLINIITPVLVNLTIVMATAVISESSISFLGLGDPTTHSWGKLLNSAYKSGAFTTAWWYSLFPSLAIMWFVVSFNFLSIGVNDALNPKISRE